MRGALEDEILKYVRRFHPDFKREWLPSLLWTLLTRWAEESCVDPDGWEELQERRQW